MRCGESRNPTSTGFRTTLMMSAAAAGRVSEYVYNSLTYFFFLNNTHTNTRIR